MMAFWSFVCGAISGGALSFAAIITWGIIEERKLAKQGHQLLKTASGRTFIGAGLAGAPPPDIYYDPIGTLYPKGGKGGNFMG